MNLSTGQLKSSFTSSRQKKNAYVDNNDTGNKNIITALFVAIYLIRF